MMACAARVFRTKAPDDSLAVDALSVNGLCETFTGVHWPTGISPIAGADSLLSQTRDVASTGTRSDKSNAQTQIQCLFFAEDCLTDHAPSAAAPVISGICQSALSRKVRSKLLVFICSLLNF